MRFAFVVLLLSLCTGPGLLFGAEPSPAVIKRAKEATALVVIPTSGKAKTFGTAFCIHPSGLFVTNKHISVQATRGDAITIVLDCGEATQREIKVKEIMSNEKYDLVVLQATSPEKLTALEIGNSDDAFDTMQITALGFPFGDALTTDRDSLPSVSVNVGRITSLRKNAGQIELLQVDAALNPGNSGGPVIDHEGKVIGIVQAGLRGTGVNFAIPAKRLQALVTSPVVTFEPNTIDVSKIDQKQKFQVRVVMVSKPAEPYSLELTLNGRDKPERKLTAPVNEEGIASFEFQPESGPQVKQFQVNLSFKSGAISGQVAEGEIKVGEATLPFAKVRRYINEQGANSTPRAELLVGESTPGKLEAPTEMKVELGSGASVTVDPRQALTISFTERPQEAYELTYLVRLMQKEQMLGQAAGKLAASSTPAASSSSNAATTAVKPNVPTVRMETARMEASRNPTETPANTIDVPAVTNKPLLAITKETPLEADKVEKKLPGAIDYVAAGGNGRFLIFHIKKVRKLAVFDVETGEMSGYISLPSDDILYGASAENLVVLVRDQSLMIRYDLATLAKELTTPLPELGEIDAMAIGYAARGVGMLMTRNGSRLFDTHTLKFLDSEPVRHHAWRPHPQHAMSIRSSADGNTYTAWCSSLSPSGLNLLQINGSSLTYKHEHNSAGALLPNQDGSMIFASSGIFNSDLRPIAASAFNRMTCLPAYHASYFVALSGIDSGWTNLNQAAKPKIAFYTAGDRRLLFSLNDIEELAPVAQEGRVFGSTPVLPIEMRLHYLPTANLLLTVGRERDTIILRRLRILDELKKADIDYLYVDSLPVTTAQAGEPYEYQLAVQSRQGALKFTLESGPDGMTISDDGKLKWEVPAETASGSTGVIVSVTDASQQQVMQSFVIRTSR